MRAALQHCNHRADLPRGERNPVPSDSSSGHTTLGKTPNVWLAVDDSNTDVEYAAKRPLGDDTNDGALSNAPSAFKYELEMQRLFARDPMIRTLVDYVPDSEPGGPMMVL